MDQSVREAAPAGRDDVAEQVRKLLPPAPEGLLGFYARWMPFFAIIFGSAALYFSFITGFVLTALSPLVLLAGPLGAMATAGAYFQLALSILPAILTIAGGFRMRRGWSAGWRILFLAYAVWAIEFLALLAIPSLLIILVLGYLHLLVKPRYA